MALYEYRHFTYNKTHPCATWYMEITETEINHGNNTSRVNINFWVAATHNKTYSETYNKTNSPWAKIFINGTQVASKAPAKFDCRWGSGANIAPGTTYNLCSYSGVFQHNGNGYLSLNIKCQHFTDVSPRTVNLETNQTFSTLNPYRLTYLSVPGGVHDIGSNITIVGNTCSSSLNHALNVSLDNANWINIRNGLQFSPANSSNATYTFTIPNDLKQWVAKQGTATMYVKLSTWNNGKYIGVETKTTTIRNPDQDLRISYLNIPGGYKYLGSEMRVNVNPCDTNLDHLLWTSLDNYNWTKVKDTFRVWSAWADNGVSFIVPDQYRSNIPAKSEHTMYVSLDTYKNGVYIGSDRKAVTAYNNYDKTIGDFTLSGSMPKEDGKYIHRSNSRIITDLRVTYDYVPYGVTYTITGPNGYRYSKWYDTTSERVGLDIYLHWPNQPGATGTHTFTSPVLPYTGTYTITVEVRDGRATSDMQQFFRSLTVTFEEEYKFLSIQGSYVDSSLSRDMINGKYYKDHSRVGIKIKFENTHQVTSLTAKIGSESFNLNSYLYNNASYTCPNKLKSSGSVKIELNAKDINGLTDTKIMYITVDEEKKPPKVPELKPEHGDKSIVLLSEGEKLVFKGSSNKLEDYQIIYAVAPCDVFKATSIYTSANSYADADKAQLSSRLHANTSSSLSYHIFKDFGVGYDDSAIRLDPDDDKLFHLHPPRVESSYPDPYFALQWLKYAKPGDMIYVYIRERTKKILADEYFYSDSYSYNSVPKNKMLAMCVIPPAPGKLEIYEVAQTGDKYVIEYVNPLKDFPDLGNKNPIHLVDICLIAKDKNGKVLNTSKQKRRDGLNGRTRFSYSDRQWHCVVSKHTSKNNYYDKYTMEFDISKYPKGTNISVIGFYYSNYYEHPTLYSTSNVLRTQRQPLDFKLSFESPTNGSIITDPNPEIKLKVNATRNISTSIDEPIYDDVNYSIKYKRTDWISDPIWIRSPRTRNTQYPRFVPADVCAKNNYYKSEDNYPNKRMEFYTEHKSLYNTTFKLDKNAKSESIYLENCLYLQSGENLIDLGDIFTEELSNKGSKVYSWKQDVGKFLKFGENEIMAYTCPYKYGSCYFDIHEKNGYWLTDTIFISNSIMPYNYYRESIVRPDDVEDWTKVESDVLFIEIPYNYLKPNHNYSITFTSHVNNGFKYDEDYTYSVMSSFDSNNPAETKICKSYMFINMDYQESKLLNVKYTKNNVIYSPAYTVVDTSESKKLINNYEKEMTHTIYFTAPTNTDKEKPDNKFRLEISARGVDKLKLSKLKLNNLSMGTKEDLTTSREIDENIEENKITIKVSVSSANITYTYINPLDYSEHTALRDYLIGIASQYNLSLEPGWRYIKRNVDGLLARDYNDIRSFCITMFNKIHELYPTIFTGENIKYLNELPIMEPGVSKHGLNDYNKESGHPFTEWDLLIEALRKQTFVNGIAPPIYDPPKPTDDGPVQITSFKIDGLEFVNSKHVIDVGSYIDVEIEVTKSGKDITSASLILDGANQTNIMKDGAEIDNNTYKYSYELKLPNNGRNKIIFSVFDADNNSDTVTLLLDV